MHIMHICAYFEFACICIIYISFRHIWSTLVMFNCWILWKILSLIQGFQGSEEEG